MKGPIALLIFAAAVSLPPASGADEVVFRSDVSLVRVDAQVVDRDNRAVMNLGLNDFVLREEGRERKITHFDSEEMPVDVVLLLDVSASMRPHVERIAAAAHQALRVLAEGDRVAIMVFDRSTRVRLPFRGGYTDVEREFENLLRQESFNGGTDIVRGLLDAAAYVARDARKEARRAIVILTDDETERNRDDEAVERALTRVDAVLMALIAPNALSRRVPRGGGGGSYPPGGGGGLGGPLGGIIFGRRGGGNPGGPLPGGGGIYGSRTRSAGTSEIARASGGDSVPVSDASAFQDTLARIRQRYALHFQLPEGVAPGQERNIQVDLAASARRRYPDAEVRYRRVYLAPGGDGGVQTEPTLVTRAPAGGSPPAGGGTAEAAPSPGWKRRPAVDQSGAGSHAGPLATGGGESSQPGWRRTTGTETATPPPAAEPQAPADNSRSGGWRKAKPEELP